MSEPPNGVGSGQIPQLLTCVSRRGELSLRAARVARAAAALTGYTSVSVRYVVAVVLLDAFAASRLDIAA